MMNIKQILLKFWRRVKAKLDEKANIANPTFTGSVKLPNGGTYVGDWVLRVE